MNPEQIEAMLSHVTGSPVRVLREVSGGLSGASKFLVEHEGSLWMAKLIEGGAGRLPFYEALSKVRCGLLASPRYYSTYLDNALCVMSPWIEGPSLEDLLRNGNSDRETYASDVASSMRCLHQVQISFPGYGERVGARIKELCDEIDNQQIAFPYQRETLSYLRGAASDFDTWKPCLVHGDVRPENFIVQDGRAVLIDFENGRLGGAEEDFAYLMLIGPDELRPFSKQVTKRYGVDLSDEEFWSKVRMYGTLKVVEYVLWKWGCRHKIAQLQPSNLYHQYHGFERSVPMWMEE